MWMMTRSFMAARSMEWQYTALLKYILFLQKQEKK
jgi:hypothetical protein